MMVLSWCGLMAILPGEPHFYRGLKYQALQKQKIVCREH